MNLLKAIFRRQPEKRSTLTNPAAWMYDAFGARKSTSGVSVNTGTAMTYAAFYAAVRVISESVAGLPLILYERVGDRDRRRAMGHPAAAVMSTPNEVQSRFVFREALQVNLCTWGNGYARIHRTGANQPDRLELIEPSRIRPVERDGRSSYDLDGKTPISGRDMLHIQNLGDGIEGYSPVRLAREQIGQGLAADRHGAKFWRNNSAPGGVLSYPGQFEDEEDVRRLRASIEQQTGGDNAFKTLVLEEGMTWAPMSVPNDDAQWLESRRFELEEVARFFRVPPHMIGALDRATFNNIEHMSIEFVTNTLRPWLIRWEQECDRKLLEKKDRERFYFEHLVEGLLRGDTETRFAAYATAIQNGYMTRNEVRVRENLEVMDGLDEFLVPLNLGTVGSEQPPAEDEQDDDTERGRRPEVQPETRDAQAIQTRSVSSRQQAADAFRAIFEDAATRSVGRETNSIKRAVKRYLAATPSDPAGFLVWLRKFYADDLPPFLREVFRSPFSAFTVQLLRVLAEELGRGVGGVDVFLASYLDAFVSRYTIRNRAELEKIVNRSGVADVGGAVTDTLSTWREKRAGTVASEELTKLNGSVSRVTYENEGVDRVRWVNTGTENCPICMELNGRTVSGRDAFAQEGDDIAGGRTQGGLTVSHTIKHPPAHLGCDCMLVAEFNGA